MAAFHANIGKEKIEDLLKEQKKLDENFDEILENEYADDQIGDVDG